MIYNIRNLKMSDLDGIESLFNECFSGGNYDDGYMIQLEWILEHGDSRYLICANNSINADLIGYAHGSIGQRIGELEFLAVKREYRKNGVGKALILEMAYRLGSNGAEEIHLIPTSKNQFYKSMGFKLSESGEMIANTKNILRRTPY